MRSGKSRSTIYQNVVYLSPVYISTVRRTPLCVRTYCDIILYILVESGEVAMSDELKLNAPVLKENDSECIKNQLSIYLERLFRVKTYYNNIEECKFN